MKWNYYIRCLLLVFVSMFAIITVKAQLQPYKSINSGQDDYAVAFRTMQSGSELWITTSRGKDSAVRRSKKIMIAPVGTSGVGEFAVAPLPINQVRNNGKNAQVELDGCPVFSQCDGNYGIMVSNRLLPNGKSAGNDLYEMIAAPNGEWSVKRLDVLNSEFWDDTPALSSDGKFLYFSSDRRSPGRRLTDIFISTKTSSGWSTPIALEGINNTEYSEQTPFMGGDGYLYYATNRSGDYDIWRVEINRTTGMPNGTPSPFDMKGVNQVGSDEGHPLFSPGGEWFLFTSNRSELAKQTKDFDLYQVHAFQPEDTLQLTVLLRTQKVTASGEFEDVTEPQATSVIALDRSSERFTQNTDNRGMTQFVIPRTPTKEPAFDRRLRSIIVRAQEKNPEKQISSVDTLLFDGLCRNRLSHTLIIWDTATYFTTGCRQDFPIVNVQFFVTAYWCPTTLKYQNYTLCGSVFPKPDCKIVESVKPPLPCESNDLYHYKLNYTEPTVEVSRPYGLCADLNEARQHGADYAQKVDSAVTKFIENMEIALRQPCVQRAIRANKPVTIEVVGWTDPRSIDNRCIYTGRDINLMTSFVQLQKIDQKPYISNGILRNGTSFSKSGAGGNQMLSDLRAYYTATMLDSLWQEQLPEYRSLRQRKGALTVVAIGKAISLERGASYGQQRSVNVRIIAEDEDLKESKKIPLPSSSTVVCGDDCLRNQAMTASTRSYSPPKKDITELPKPIISKPMEQPQEVRDAAQPCYTILFHTFISDVDARKLQTEIQSKKFINVRVIPFTELSGRQFFRVLSGCYKTNEAAELVERELPPLLQTLSVECKTMIVQE
jgi:hypothetical protein